MTFEMCQGTRAGFTSLKNAYDTTDTDLSKSLRVLFTNTGDSLVAPTGYKADVRPFAIMMGVGVMLALALAITLRRKKKEQ